MNRLIIFILPVFLFFAPLSEIMAQNGIGTQNNESSNLNEEISLMINDLELKFDQQLAIGIILLKYAAEFDFSEFEESSKSKQYILAKSKLKDFEKDLKEILDKDQFKVYKKHRKKIKKELLKSV